MFKKIKQLFCNHYMPGSSKVVNIVGDINAYESQCVKCKKLFYQNMMIDTLAIEMQNLRCEQRQRGVSKIEELEL